MKDAQSTRPSSRSGAIDAVRVLGIIAVVAGHVWGDTVIGKIVYPWHVPVFFFLAGYLWTPGRPLRLELSKRWASLGRPYLTWLALIIALFAVVLHEQSAFSWSMLWAPLYGGGVAVRPFTTLWFVSTLFFTALLYRCVERLPLWSQIALACAGLAAAAFAGHALATTPLAIGMALPCLAFVLAGRQLPFLLKRLKHPALVGLGLLAVSAALVASSLSPQLDLKAGYFGVPVLGVLVAIAISAGLILVANELVPRLGSRFSASATALASGGMFVVLAHPVVLWLLNTPAHGRVLGFAVALIVPWMLALISVRTPFAPWLVGVRRVRPRPRAKTLQY